MNEFHPHHSRETYETVVERCVNIVKYLGDKIDHIAVRGASGLVVGSVVAYKTGKMLAVIRKDGEDVHCHSWMSSGTTPDPKRTVWIDDFISGGTTFEAVIKRLGGRPRFVILYYSSNRFMCVSPDYVGLKEDPYTQYLYHDEPALMAPHPGSQRFEWPKPPSSR